MAAIEAVEIRLQYDIDEQYQYQPGEIIRGVITLSLARSVGIRLITARVVGEGSVSWKDPENEEVCQAHEVYIDASKAVIDMPSPESLNLERGKHEFNFDYVLPEHIPSSYIGKYGNVTYTMRVLVQGTKSSDQAISSEPFLVLRRMPLPPEVLQPVSMENEKRLWGSCSFGKVHIKMSVEQQGGVPGEDIFIHAEVKNHSHRTITAMQASLIMQSRYRAQSKTIEFRQVVSKKRDEFDISRNEGRRWNFVRLTVPPYLPESKLEHCDIIDLDYELQFRIELSGGSEVRVETPFFVGGIPAGLEVPSDARAGVKINRHWTVRGAPADLAVTGDLDEPPSDYNDEIHDWGMETVPEMRNSAVISNPLFRHNSYLNKGIKVMPEEFIENTRL